MAKKDIPLKSFRPLFELLEPMDEIEATKLGDYLRSLMPDLKATEMPYMRFCEFASAVESIAYRRSWQIGDESRKIIFKILSEHGGNDDFHAAPVPTGKGPNNGPRLDSAAELKHPVEENEAT